MRVHANRDSALVLAAQASKAVPKITTIPELKGIHMEADARLAMLTMTATNQEVSIRASMPAAVEESGSAVIPADLLPDILKRLPGDQVSFSTVGPGIIHIGSGYAEYRLNILDAAKYPLPEVPFLEDTIPVSGICSLARQTLFAAAAGDQQNILKTVRLKVGPYGLKATSSNGFCIAEAAGDKNCVAASETCILVPARSLSILAAISLDSDVYQMGLTREGLAFWNGTTMFCTHLIDGSYADVCSNLYARTIRIGREMGYTRFLTYTLPEESGSSLRAVGFQVDGVVHSPSGGWNAPSRPRSTRRYPSGDKVRWVLHTP